MTPLRPHHDVAIVAHEVQQKTVALGPELLADEVALGGALGLRSAGRARRTARREACEIGGAACVEEGLADPMNVADALLVRGVALGKSK